MIRSWDDVFDAFDRSPSKLALALGTSPQATYGMMQRGSIPSRWWSVLVATCARRHIRGVTYEALGRIAAASGGGRG